MTIRNEPDDESVVLNDEAKEQMAGIVADMGLRKFLYLGSRYSPPPVSPVLTST